MRRLPDTVVIYRGGVSDSQQEVILERLVLGLGSWNPTDSLVASTTVKNFL